MIVKKKKKMKKKKKINARTPKRIKITTSLSIIIFSFYDRMAEMSKQHSVTQNCLGKLISYIYI